MTRRNGPFAGETLLLKSGGWGLDAVDPTAIYHGRQPERILVRGVATEP
jgi:hypothetical protein